MIYFDNAATTFPKPTSVINAVSNAMRFYGANPGRGGHNLAIKASEEIYKCRKIVANFFNAYSEEGVIFTLNCTHAINIVIKGLLEPKDHVVVSCLEHNSVMRPLKTLEKIGVTYTQAKVYPGDNDKTLDSFRNSINNKTKLIICTHASNVWGVRLPIERITALAHQYEIPVLVDAAQTAGVLPIDIKDCGIDYFCAPGHKGLYGPMGTGILIVKDADTLDSLMEGGTGTSSITFDQPNILPDKFESGTANMPGIVGLKSGVEYLKNRKVENIVRHEYMLINRLYDELSKIKEIKLYMQKPDPKYFVPLLSFNIEGKDSETVARMLNQRNIAVRAGLHCSPTAHKFCDTLETGAVRVCPSAFNKISEVEVLMRELKRIIKK